MEEQNNYTPRVEPKKDSPLKEWSMSNRLLKQMITSIASNYDIDHIYKFVAVYDNKFKLFRIWNIKSKNVICTIKRVDKVIYIRYRNNSYYRETMANFKLPNTKVISVPSDNLSRNRGNYSYAQRYCRLEEDTLSKIRIAAYMAHKNKEVEKKIVENDINNLVSNINNLVSRSRAYWLNSMSGYSESSTGEFTINIPHPSWTTQSAATSAGLTEPEQYNEYFMLDTCDCSCCQQERERNNE